MSIEDQLGETVNCPTSYIMKYSANISLYKNKQIYLISMRISVYISGFFPPHLFIYFSLI